MKIELLRIIKNALIGGKNGEMAFIYNSPLVRELYDEFESTKCEDEKFVDFLNSAISNTDEKKEARGNIQVSIPLDKAKEFVNEENYIKMKEAQKIFIEAKAEFNKWARVVGKELNSSYISNSFEFSSGEKIYFDSNSNDFKGKIDKNKLID